MKGSYYLAKRGAATPDAADFCVTVCDDCMSPYIKAGDTVYVSCREPVNEMDAALFYLDGRVICRQWCEDYRGTLHLLCANPAREDRNISLSPAKRRDCLCLGRVLMKKQPPAPLYSGYNVCDTLS